MSGLRDRFRRRSVVAMAVATMIGAVGASPASAQPGDEPGTTVAPHDRETRWTPAPALGVGVRSIWMKGAGSGPDGYAFVIARRDGWSVSADVWVLDYRDEDGLLSGNDCTYAILTLDVAGFEDPSTTKADVRPKDCTANRYAAKYHVDLRVGWGTEIRELRVQVCRDDAGSDPCGTTWTLDVPPPLERGDVYAVGRTRYANTLMFDTSLSRFLEVFRTYTGTDAAGFDWKQDGCSNPVPGFGDIYNPIFRDACIRHDFGYRNLGQSSQGNGYRMSDAARLAVDRQLVSDARTICDTRKAAQDAPLDCYAAANAYLKGVRLGGGGTFYGTARKLPSTRVEKTGRYQVYEAGGEVPVPDADPPPDTTAPTLTKPVTTLAAPGSRTVNFTIQATDDVDDPVPYMRVRVSGGEWREWRPYVTSGTVILPDTYGTFTVWFQVRDNSGNVSLQRAGENVTRTPDTTPPTLGKPAVSLAAVDSRTVNFALAASDDRSGPEAMQLRVRVSGEDWRPWVAYVAGGTVVLPDRYGPFTVWFQVRDAAGNLSFERAGDNVTRTAQPTVTLQQITNLGVTRSCGAESNPCSDAATSFRVTISSPVLPPGFLQIRRWRLIDGSWVEGDKVYFAIDRSTFEWTFPPTATKGLWRFQAAVPADPGGTTGYAESGVQYLRLD